VEIIPICVHVFPMYFADVTTFRQLLMRRSLKCWRLLCLL